MFSCYLSGIQLFAMMPVSNSIAYQSKKEKLGFQRNEEKKQN